ncbi:MAG: ribonuclease III [Candidatus Pacebacteria bacterium]|nr:ribonuclease III [Candidatus Paceibacterota bacterium]
MKEFDQFEASIGITFTDKRLLETAFTHRSFINEHKKKDREHNERLEFLGDAVLELVVTEFLYAKYPKKTEGDLTSYRAGLVNTSTLSTVATGLGMNDYLLLSKGETKDVGRARQYILANTFEAFTGALYLDAGYDAAKGFIEAHLLPLTEDIVGKHLWQDAKSRFQEMAQDKAGITPSYKTVHEEGPDHDKKFTVGVFLGEEKIGEGAGNSKQEAEQAAAHAALEVKKEWA